jgi:hypothetical protein
MSTRVRVLKWAVAVDDEPHEIGGGDVVHVDVLQSEQIAARRHVSVWTRELVDDELQPIYPKRTAQVYGTGQLVDGAIRHVGSVVDRTMFMGGLSSELVWHVFEVEQP